MTRTLLAMAFVVAAAPPELAPGALADPASSATTVEPAELTRRPELVGRLVSVDDRVALFWNHPGRDYDEITLKRTPVVFRLPPRLRYRQSPGAPAVRLQGVLKREGDGWVCDVTAIELFPKDLERLNRGVAVLPAADHERRTAWAAWAERRGKAFQDEDLLNRARQVEAEAIRIEADQASSDQAGHWLKLARRARDHQVAEPEPSALAHRAFQARAAKVRTVEEARGLVSEVASFFPEAPAPTPAPERLAQWEAPYASDPAGAYRTAPGPVRKALDHRLWADATQRLLELQAAAEPEAALTLADQARDRLPDRPEVAERLLQQGLNASTTHVDTLRLAEVQSLADLYRTRLRQPDRARELLRRWLENQRIRHLSPTDAEGRVALAAQYEKLIDDKTTAVELLQSAWKIDPQSRDVADAFRRRGFRKVNDEWVEPTARAGRERDPAPAREQAGGFDPQTRRLLGTTPQQVRALIGGKPNRIILTASQGQLVEQWIYLGASRNQYINFLRIPGEGSPRVIAYYSLPRTVGSARP